jgi:hypothetical protein
VSLTNPEAGRCFYSVVEGGEIVLGAAKVALVNPVAIQGGSTKAVEGQRGTEKHDLGRNRSGGEEKRRRKSIEATRAASAPCSDFRSSG